ncbi:MAG: hypothetical protein BWX88_00588 [Planctomycetes bacterium ADurb.Bin126]|nr:MAG: hypothetical protein BWX88_00588 [Planctomycetes bacterium ADurb.Bin126]
MAKRTTTVVAAGLLVVLAVGALGHGAPAPAAPADELLQKLDAPLLFVKQFNYLGIHIYDVYYKWRPGGGIYIIENPSDPPARHRIRPVIDATTPNSLGKGVYFDPDLSYDAKKLLFCYKNEAHGSTCIYEINIDGTGLRKVTDPSDTLCNYHGGHGGQHDVFPCYLPDGRILFNSTRKSGLVPCANSGVDIMHTMEADGSNIRPLSVNNVNEFDPVLLNDGRIMFGRWEYVDKTALTQQSLWTIFPDGTNETALYANNMVFPEAVLDARPVPGTTNLIVGSFTKHNAPPRGTIGMILLAHAKNDPAAIHNFEFPDQPTRDVGDSCEPWPLSRDVVLYSGKPAGAKFNALIIIDRSGRRSVVRSDPEIDLHSPMLVKPRAMPPLLPSHEARRESTGRFLLQNVYDGLPGVKPGEVKSLRVVEETSRVSATPGGAYNQTFLLSCALAFSAKHFLGVVPVEEDGSAYFEAPSGKALYFQALDADGRLVRSMRTFVQATPGVTRSCIGCHEYKYGAPPRRPQSAPLALSREPSKLKDESWGSGFMDFPSMVQPILDKHCVSCHGGAKGFAGRLDLTGGWTEHFSISYENLTARRHTQLVAHLISGIDCMNGTAWWSAQIFGPRQHGSATAPLAHVLVSGHKDRIPNLTRTERDLLMAWIDSNGLFHGNWDYTKNGPAIRSWAATRKALRAKLDQLGCMKCHTDKHIENDWINLRQPQLSRVLRAPLKAGGDGFGAALCRNAKQDPERIRTRLLYNGFYQHAVQPLKAYESRELPPPNTQGEPVITFASTADAGYQDLLAIIRSGREQALAAPRVDMPGAEIIAGASRQIFPTPIPHPLPQLKAAIEGDGVVRLAWEQSARTIGLTFELHRLPLADAPCNDKTLLTSTTLFSYTDADVPAGRQHYALIAANAAERSEAVRLSVEVPPPAPPPAPAGLTARALPGRVELSWQGAGEVRYSVYRSGGGGEPAKLTPEPIALSSFVDAVTEGTYAYTVRSVSRRGAQSPPSQAAQATALPEPREAVFVADFAAAADATVLGGGKAAATVHGPAKAGGGLLDLRKGGFVTYARRAEWDLAQTGRFSIECWVKFEQPGQMPVVLSAGLWRSRGWFLQRIGAGWRWHVGGIDCDGGTGAVGQWTHLAAVFDGRQARLFQDGKQVAEVDCAPVRTPWENPMYVGQYSGTQEASYQVSGWIGQVKVYVRPLTQADAARAFQAGPPKS